MIFRLKNITYTKRANPSVLYSHIGDDIVSEPNCKVMK